MNGTRNWCTLVDVHPEGQTAVRRSGYAASPARYPRFPVPPLPCPAPSSLTSPGAGWGPSAPRRAPSLFFFSAVWWRAAGVREGSREEGCSETRGVPAL